MMKKNIFLFGLLCATLSFGVLDYSGGYLRLYQVNPTAGMVISANGNVGIGTESPGTKFHVASQTYPQIKIDYGSGYYMTASHKGEFDTYSNGENSYNFQQEGVSRLYIKNGGNVGIGTTSPVGIFEVFVTGNGRTAGVVRVVDKDVTIGVVSPTPGDHTAFKVVQRDGASVLRTGGNGDLYLGYADLIKIPADAPYQGNVGIGTTAPSTKLDIYNAGTGTVLRVGGISTGTTNDAGIDFYAVNGAAKPAYARIGLGVDAGGIGSESGNLNFLTIASGLLSEKMRITSGGNVGIGTATPDETLTVKSTIGLMSAGNNTRLKITGSETMNTIATSGGTPLRISTTGGNALSFQTNGVDLVTLGASNVGIGTTSPQNKLHIYDTAAVVGGGQLDVQGAQGGYGSGVLFTTAAQDTGVYKTQAKIVADGTGNYNSGNSSYSSKLSFWTINANSLTEKMVIKEDGKIGIGTTAPSTKLEVAGTVSASALVVNGNVGIGTTAPTSKLAVIGNNSIEGLLLTGGDGQWAGRINTSGITGNSYGLLIGAGTNGADVGFTVESASGSPYFRVRGDGNVGIGTTGPIAKLEVSGGNVVVGGGYGLYRNYAGSARGIIYNPSAGLTTIRPIDNNATDGIRLEDWAGNAALFVRQDGNVGIGTTAPSTKLEVAGTVSASALQVNGTAAVNVGGGAASPQLLVEGDGAAYNAQIALRRANSTSAGGNIDWIGNTNVIGARIGVNDDIGGAMQFKLGGTGAIGDTKITITSAGNVGIGTTTPSRKLSVNGDAGGTSAWNNDSDVRLKRDIVTIPDALAKVKQLRGVNFSWKDTSHHPGGNQMGFIAQEALNVIPEVVSKPGEYYSMQYAPITALLVEAMKQQQIQIEKLVSENEQLKRDMVETRRLLAR